MPVVFTVATSNAPLVIVKLPVLAPVAVVVPSTNTSALSSHIIAALSPVEPRSMIKPKSLALDPAPLLSSIKLSLTTLFVVDSVVVVPFTVKLPVIVASPPIVTSSGSPIVIVLSETAVSISLAVPTKFSVSVPTVTVSSEPLSAPIVNALALLTCESTYALVAASWFAVGSVTLTILLVSTSIVPEPFGLSTRLIFVSLPVVVIVGCPLAAAFA